MLKSYLTTPFFLISASNFGVVCSSENVTWKHQRRRQVYSTIRGLRNTTRFFISAVLKSLDHWFCWVIKPLTMGCSTDCLSENSRKEHFKGTPMALKFYYSFIRWQVHVHVHGGRTTAAYLTMLYFLENTDLWTLHHGPASWTLVKIKLEMSLI